MASESLAWFAGQAAGIGVAFLVGRRVSMSRPIVWTSVAAVATICMLAWPLARRFPTEAIQWVGGRAYSFLEMTGIVIPAALLFTIAARQTRTVGQRRAMVAMLAVCSVAFAKHSTWMLHSPVGDLGPTKMVGRVCRQSTGYTCVAASLVTMLEAYGLDATETEMARLTYTELDDGTTDVRAVAGLETKLSGKPIDVRYEKLDYGRLCNVPKPCVVTIKWNAFTAHAVTVLWADADQIKLADPLEGRTLKPAAWFKEVWFGTAIYLIDKRPAKTTSNS